MATTNEEKAVAIATVPIATRLNVFGLNAANLSLTNDLVVPANQTVTLDANDPKFAKQMSKLTPKTIDDLKSWIGTPDAAFANAAAPARAAAPMLVKETVLPVLKTYTPDQSAAMYNVARQYVFGNSAAIDKAQIPALNAWLGSIAGNINILFWQDITVSAGAKLIVAASTHVLFARYITIDKGGLIQVKCTQASIKCAGVKGL